MEYRELLPDASLRHVVRRYWFLTGDDVSGEPGEPALPDGWCAASTPDRRVARAVLAIRAATVVVQDAIARDVGTTPLGWREIGIATRCVCAHRQRLALSSHLVWCVL